MESFPTLYEPEYNINMIESFKREIDSDCKRYMSMIS